MSLYTYPLAKALPKERQDQ